jgi:hypothetical protein
MFKELFVALFGVGILHVHNLHLYPEFLQGRQMVGYVLGVPVSAPTRITD